MKTDQITAKLRKKYIIIYNYASKIPDLNNTISALINHILTFTEAMHFL